MTMPEVGHTFEPGDDEHDTPGEFVAPLADAVDGFDLDPCASSTSNLAERNVTKSEDGMSMDWYGDVWLNPPYSDVSDWLAYAVDQHEQGNTDRIVALVFSRTGTQWWHNYAATADYRCLVEGRLRFGNADNSAPAPSAVCVWDPTYTPELLKALHEGGEVFM